MRNAHHLPVQDSGQQRLPTAPRRLRAPGGIWLPNIEAVATSCDPPAQQAVFLSLLPALRACMRRQCVMYLMEVCKL